VLSRIFIPAGIVFILAAAGVIDAGPKRIAIVGIHQKGGIEPVTITVFVSIPPAPENRGYKVIAQCRRDDGLSTESFRQLAGDASIGPFVPTEFRLAGCVYAVGAVLLGERGRVLAMSDLRTVRVQCRSCDDREDEP
jgi:hypothetical protein